MRFPVLRVGFVGLSLLIAKLKSEKFIILFSDFGLNWTKFWRIWPRRNVRFGHLLAPPRANLSTTQHEPWNAFARSLAGSYGRHLQVDGSKNPDFWASEAAGCILWAETVLVGALRRA